MHYVTKLPARLALWAQAAGIRTAAGALRSFAFVWEFGAPGHGKGVWDGLGAWMKRTVRQDIVDHRPPSLPTIKTDTGTILSPAEVRSVLLFCACILAAIHTKSATCLTYCLRLPSTSRPHLIMTSMCSRTCRTPSTRYTLPSCMCPRCLLMQTCDSPKVIVMYTPTDKIERPKPDHDYDTMDGMKKTFLFMAVRDSVILQRKFACWCPSCAQMSAPGEGEMDSSFRCAECDTHKEQEAGKGEYLKWAETSIARRDAAGVANDRSRALTHSRSLRDQLIRKFEQSNEPVWVAVQNRGEHVISPQCSNPTPRLLPKLAATSHCTDRLSPEMPPTCRIRISIGWARHCQSIKFTRRLAATGVCAMIKAMSNSMCSGTIATSVAAMSDESSSDGRLMRRQRIRAQSPIGYVCSLAC